MTNCETVYLCSSLVSISQYITVLHEIVKRKRSVPLVQH